MKTKVIIKILVGVIVIGGGISYFMYRVAQSSYAYYYSLDDFTANKGQAQNYSLRIAGKVKAGTVKRDLEKMDMTFVLAGTTSEMPVHYEGTVPETFAEDGDVVIEGSLDTKGTFHADALITRYESKYKAKAN